MAGDEDGVVAHRPQALGDAVDQLLVVALRKVRGTNAAGKQHIADEAALNLRGMKHHMAGVWPGVWRTCRVSRPTCTVSPSSSQRVGTKVPAGGKPNIRALLGQAVDPELVASVGADDGHIGLLGQGRRPPAWWMLGVG